MNAYSTEAIRKKYKMTWNEEYIVSMVKHHTRISTMRVLEEAKRQGIMSPATTHKYLSQALAKRLLKHAQDGTDLRSRAVVLAPRGEHFLQEIKDAYI